MSTVPVTLVRYREGLPAVEAVHLVDDPAVSDPGWEAIAKWCGGRLVNHEIADSGEHNTVLVFTSGGAEVTAVEGDWIVKTGDGEFCLWLDEEFQAGRAPVSTETVQAGTAQGDVVSAELAKIRERAEDEKRGIDRAADDVPWSCEDALRLVALADALLKPHEPITVYAIADGCGCERPAEDSDEFEEWDADHSWGNDQGGETGEPICYRTPLYQACPACTKLVYGNTDSESWISTGDCLVRPVAEKVLAGTGGVS